MENQGVQPAEINTNVIKGERKVKRYRRVELDEEDQANLLHADGEQE
jgi:hypothetical protein